MYRFLVTPKWLAFAALMVLLAAVMVALGFWQLHRYHERGAVNARIDAAAFGAPVPVGQVLTGQARELGESTSKAAKDAAAPKR